MLDLRVQKSYSKYMNKLSSEERTKILHLLCEGMSIRVITRITGKSKNTISKLLIDAGKACAAYHQANVRDLQTTRVEVDEIWSFTYAKQNNVKMTKSAPAKADDTWTWTAIDADSKMIVSGLVGGRDVEYAMWFMDDLRNRLANRVQLISDGQKVYLEAFEDAFGADVDYAQLIKIYGNAPDNFKDHYSPADCTGTRKGRVKGRPDKSLVSTSYVERANPTIRMHKRRFTRLTNDFSKKIDNHSHAVALHIMYYNFVHIHKTLKVSPAMAAGVTDRLWDTADIVLLIEKAEAEAASKKRRPYKNAISN